MLNTVLSKTGIKSKCLVKYYSERLQFAVGWVKTAYRYCIFKTQKIFLKTYYVYEL